MTRPSELLLCVWDDVQKRMVWTRAGRAKRDKLKALLDNPNTNPVGRSKMTENTYDKRDIVRLVRVLHADGPLHQLKVAAYRVRDPETKEFSKLQFHITMDNTVMAMMGEGMAAFFADFVKETIAAEKPNEHPIQSDSENQPTV